MLVKKDEEELENHFVEEMREIRTKRSTIFKNLHRTWNKNTVSTV